MFLRAATNQLTILGVALCHKKLGCPCYTPEEELSPLSYINLSYPKESLFLQNFYKAIYSLQLTKFKFHYLEFNILLYLTIQLLEHNKYTGKIIAKFSSAKPLLHQVIMLI
jgi:hypothetical protein